MNATAVSASLSSFTRQLRVINDSRVDGIVLWCDAPVAALILKQMKQMV
jgi:hypothetical protein